MTKRPSREPAERTRRAASLRVQLLALVAIPLAAGTILVAVLARSFAVAADPALRESLAWFSLAALLVFGIAAAAAWRYAGRIGDAIERLNHAARALGHGAPVSVPPLGILEADQLAGALAQASADLQTAGELLARNEARWSAVLDCAMDGIVAADGSLRIVVFNPAAERIFGWSREEALGQPIAMLIPEPHRAMHDAAMRDFGATGAGSRRMGRAAIVPGLRKDGAVFPMEASISHLRTGDGDLYTVIARDVSQETR